MVNALVTTTALPVEPGIYGKITASASVGPTSIGVVAIVGRASTGPLGSVSVLGSPAAVAAMYGASSAQDRSSVVSQIANLAREASVGGAIQFVCARVGVGGTKAALTLNDGIAAPVGSLAHPYAGVLANALRVTIRAVAGDATQKELVVYNGSTVVQVSRFPAASSDEALGLQTATVGQPYAVFTKSAIGNGVLASITNVAMSTVVGADPTIANGDYTTALALLSSYPWAAVVTDSEVPAVHSALSAFINAETKLGRFRVGSVGEPTSVAEATRRTNATVLNDCLLRYIGNGYQYPNADGTTRNIEGFLAAAQQAGVMSTLEPGHSMTWRQVPGATGIIAELSDKASAISAGMGYFESSAHGFRTGAGISTLVNAGNAPIWALAIHNGWKKLEHVATAFGLLSEIGDAWDEVVANPVVNARPPNSDAGRIALTAIANRSTIKYIDRGWLLSGTVILDPANPPTADVAFFTFDDLVIALRAERLLLELPFAQS